MPKTRLQKTELVQTYTDWVQNAKMVVVLKYAGLTVPQAEKMRDTFFEHQERLAIVKNNLLIIALGRLGKELPAEIYGQPLLITTGEEDEVTVAKDAATFTKEFGTLEILAGIYEGRVITAAEVNELASLPTKEELLAKTVATLYAPVTGFVNVLRGNISGLVNVLRQIEAQKS